MDTIITILNWLDGKKTHIVSFLQLTCAFLGVKGYFDQDTQAYIQGVIALLASGAETATVKLGARKA